ncbi:RagB/SusD family nutrient uptake outer membrane protein [Bacteroides congonensis]
MKLKYLFLISIAFTSCSDFLDVKPIGKLIPTEIEEFENLLNNESTIKYHFMDNNNTSFYSMLADNLSISENQDKYKYISSYVNKDVYAAYTFNVPYESPIKPQYTWEWGIYRAVGLFNNVIEGIEGLDGAAGTENGKAVIAQAKAGRAWSYMVGGLGYGPMYNPDGDNSTKTIPYRTSGDPTVPNPDLATTAELMQLVKKDLDDALDAPENVVNPCRANKAAVHALRAEYFMYMRDWPNMLKEASEAWSRSLALKGSVDNMIYDFNQCYYEDDPNAEPAEGTDKELSLDLLGQDLLFNQSIHRENLFYRTAPAGCATTNGQSTYYPSDDFLALFDPDTDRRYQLFALRILGYSTTVGGIKYEDGIKRTYCRSSKMLTNQGITYPQLLLMKAEAEARTSDKTNALKDLNLLRKYRYSGDNTDLPNGSSLNEDELLYEILKERRRELPISSYQRTFDIKRFVYDTGKPWCQTTITHKIGSKTYSAPVNNEYYTLPKSNSIIEKNPQWELEVDNRPYDPLGKK